jgi:Xaa-Pro aminopeptidase
MRFLFLLILVLGSGVLAAQHDHDKAIPKTVEVNNSEYEADRLPATFHKARREELRSYLPANSVAVFFANPIRNRSNDIDYEFHQDPDFYYLTGLLETDAVLIISKNPMRYGSVITNELIFVLNRDPQQESWNGKRLGLDAVRSTLLFENVFHNQTFVDFPLGWGRFDKVLIKPQYNDIRDDKNERGDLYSMMRQFNTEIDTLPNGRVNRFKLGEIMAAMRQQKRPEEILLMRKAVEITCKGIMELMKTLRPGMKEYQSEAIVQYVFMVNGAESEGYPSILGGGSNSCILHYQTNRKELRSNDLLVCDVGAEYHGYTADVTRTLPVDGRYSPEEASIYNLVLKAQEAGIAQCKPGNAFTDPNDAAVKVVYEGLMDLGIIKKPSEFRQYFFHGTSHYLGLDVHDPGTYGKLAAGQVITVEPGIYIPDGSPCDPKWWNIGIRIEDDVLITDSGYEVMSSCIPKTIAEIERIMAQSGVFDELVPGK